MTMDRNAVNSAAAISHPLQRHWGRDNSRQRQLENDSVPQWDEAMATCFAHLKSALSAIEELTYHPGRMNTSPGNVLFFGCKGPVSSTASNILRPSPAAASSPHERPRAWMKLREHDSNLRRS
jgi:hypothetical protein